MSATSESVQPTPGADSVLCPLTCRTPHHKIFISLFSSHLIIAPLSDTTEDALPADVSFTTTRETRADEAAFVPVHCVCGQRRQINTARSAAALNQIDEGARQAARRRHAEGGAKSVQVKLGRVRSGQVRSGQGKAGQAEGGVKRGRIRPDQVRSRCSGMDKTGRGRRR